MKKIFFPKSSSSHGGERHEKSGTTRENKTVGSQNVENKFRNSEHFFPVCERKVTETKTISRSRVLRRSRTLSMSSATYDNNRFSEEDLTGLRNRQRFPSSHGECDCSDCHYRFRDRDSIPERYNSPTTKRPSVEILCNHGSSSPSNPSSPQTSFGSTSISGQVFDLYMDGDHPQDQYKTNDNRLSIPTSLQNRVSSESNLFIPSHSTSRDSLRSEHNKHESPRKLAKDVVEKLLRFEQFRDGNPNWPPMPANFSDKHLDQQSYPPEDHVSRKGCTLEDFLHEREYNTIFAEENEDVVDMELRRKLEEVKHKAMKLSKALSQERSFQYNTITLSDLTQIIRNLIEEERNLVLELSDHLQCRISERADAKKTAALLKEEIDSAVMIQESEKEKLQSRLQTELNRRSDEWESKLREFESEENGLKDRLRELSAHNLSLEREISDYCGKERDYTDKISEMDTNLKDMIAKVNETRSENDYLRKMLSDTKKKLEFAEQVESSMERNFGEKEKENTELIKTASRLRGMCTEQEKTIDGLRQCLNSEIERRETSGTFQNVTHKLQLEQSRLAETEQVLRRQLESFSVEVDSLRTENIYLLERLKGTGEMSGRSGLKLDQELKTCVQSLKSTGLSLLNESVQTCEALLKIIGRKESPHGLQEKHTVMQYDMKVQGFKQGLEQLTRNLGKAGFILKEKAELNNHESNSSESDNRRSQNMNRVEDDLKSELKAESLLTSILKEKVYFKEKEVERLHAELARALRSNDSLKSEIQDAFDTISCLNHKMKNFELQIIEKDSTINQLRGETGSQEEELGSTRRTLSKVSQERDLMWEEVKQYSEKNMLLNREIDYLKKKIDALEEDTLLKDGQITILKDSLNNAKPFDVLFGPDQGGLFKL